MLQTALPPGDAKKAEGEPVPGVAARFKRKEDAVAFKDLTCIGKATVMLGSVWFDIVMGGIIVLNSICIGAEQSYQIHRMDTTFFKVLESIFLVIYIFEIGARVFLEGKVSIHDRWLMFDVALVLLGVITSWIIEPMQKANGFGPLMVLRTLRLLRLAKTARVLVNVREFWMLARGFLSSTKLMFHTFVVLLVMLYVFSSVGVELITKHDMNMGENPDLEFQEHVSKYFASLPMTMLTLLRFVCMDDMSEVYTKLIALDPSLSAYFIAVVTIIGIILMNLVSSVILSCTLEQNTEEAEAIKRAETEDWQVLIGELREMFCRLDEDRSGQLSREELRNISAEDNKKLCVALGVNTPMQIFDALDIDHSGKVSISEFFDSIWDCALTKSPVDLKRMEKQVATMSWRLKEAFSPQEEMSLTMNEVLRSVNAVKASSKELHNNILNAELPSLIGGSPSFSPRTPGHPLPPWAEDLIRSLKAVSDDILIQVRKAVQDNDSRPATRLEAASNWSDKRSSQNGGGEGPPSSMRQGASSLAEKRQAAKARGASPNEAAKKPPGGKGGEDSRRYSTGASSNGEDSRQRPQSPQAKTKGAGKSKTVSSSTSSPRQSDGTASIVVTVV
eukprot:TRINITY_DN3537_c0_g1_i1.p1 TRINITY_DN3537_c0_g1~~TRINITY_DN3537_c0_g1_i1.p1  ORF type:complete len:617 (-),score=116.61 TRINITY_DN3537_c0_g1_i1:94-1944(-)